MHFSRKDKKENLLEDLKIKKADQKIYLANMQNEISTSYSSQLNEEEAIALAKKKTKTSSQKF